MQGKSESPGRTCGRALIVGGESCRAPVVEALGRLGYQTKEAEDAYSGMAELCQRPLAYRALVLGLASLYREELQMIGVVKRRYPHVEVWVAGVEGRAAALAEASRLGADGLLSDGGLHRFSSGQKEGGPTGVEGGSEGGEVRACAGPSKTVGGTGAERVVREAPLVDAPIGEPILTAEELRALLQEPPYKPTAAKDE